MRRDHGENAPRGTWNDDTSSERASEPRRSVSAPYRDPLQAVRLRRAALAREIDAIDRQLAERASLAAELVALDRALHAPPRVPVALVRAARAAARFAAAGIVAGWSAALALAIVHPPDRDREPAPVVVVPAETVVRAHEPSVFAVSRRDVDAVIARTDVEPVVERDVIVGLRITRPGDAEGDTLGLRRGDVIVAVNGHELVHPDGARLAFETVRTAPAFVLTIQRDGMSRRLRYEVRDADEPTRARGGRPDRASRG